MDRDIFSYKGGRLLFAITGLLTVAEGICIIIQAALLAGMVTKLFFGEPPAAIGHQAIGFFAALAGRYGSVLAIRQLSSRFAERAGSDLRKAFLSTVFALGPRAIKEEGTGNLVTLALDGVVRIRQYLERLIPKMAANGILPLMILGYVFFQDRVSALILFVTIPVLIVFMILLGLAAQKQMDKRWSAYRILSNHFIDSLRGLPTLRYLGLSKMHEATIARVSDRYRSMTMRTLRLAFLSSFALDFFTMLSIAFVAVFLGLRLVDGRMALEPALTILILAPEYFSPVRELGQDYHATLDGKEAAQKMRAFISGKKKDDLAGPAAAGEWTADSVLTLDRVSVRYEKDEKHDALENISFNVRGFEKIGVIGPSGAGKSTLVDLIGGFVEQTSGIIAVNGRPVSLSSAGWRKQMTYIPQHPYLFSASLKENIAFYAPEATDRQIMSAAEAAGLSALVRRLPRGLDEKIGGGGRALSGGQEQRVALARAFLCHRPILLLDEPTAHLDIETEYELKETMIRLFRGKLVIMATHRLHWMEQMDRLAVIQDGRLAETGTLEELLHQHGAFRALVRSQLEGVR
ncbi:thiol reductant ABC exporter subunit CydD [Sporolactobacillus sp. THM7-7]|nr:thiol reductant ABC exporter subunit CydD [Sporolactobacillus sp. THM7-7]